jgi:Rps23 Pro-64 3,4-dihydroxylase Tpa1-like proline 4-hydroxylase
MARCKLLSPIGELINPLDCDALREQVQQSTPVRNFVVDNFLNEGFAHRIADAYPSYEEALAKGRLFSGVNESGKVQVTDTAHFPEPLAQLNALLSSKGFCDLVGSILDIPDLLADDQLVGGGMHQTTARGYLDVHVDFNYLAERRWYRRANLLLFFNRGWKREWGGEFELWDADVRVRHHAWLPIFNRCVLFETNDVSYHGVTAVTCPRGQSRKSFASFYYTETPPPNWKGGTHSTLFRSRPDEQSKGKFATQADWAARWFSRTFGRAGSRPSM